MSDVVILRADARELEASDVLGFDSLICDPPYSEHVHSAATAAGTGGAATRNRDLGFDHLSPELRTAIALSAGAMKRWSVVFSDFESMHSWRDAVEHHGARYVRTVPWVRWCQPQKSGDRPGSGAEAVLHFHAKHRPRWNGSGSLISYDQKCLRGADKHPTEKPLDLMLALVSAFSDVGESIFDPTCGSGTTILAARLLDRSATGLELKGEWAQGAQARIKRRGLDARDTERATRWATATATEARTVPAPKCPRGSDVKTWERAQRRLADALRVAKAIGVAV